jgi:hypothetical protein
MSLSFKSAGTVFFSLLAFMSVAEAQVYQNFAYYDESELPGIHMSPSWNEIYGVFFYPTLDISPIFTIERMRFWHIDYNEERDPYRVLLVVRNTAAEHLYLLDIIEGLWTTCTNCWEDVEIEFTISDSSTPEWSFGIFVEPLGGHLTSAEPRVRTDFTVSQPLVNLIAGYVEDYGFYQLTYTEELGWGDFFMEIVVRYDEITTTESTTISTIKALY